MIRMRLGESERGSVGFFLVVPIRQTSICKKQKKGTEREKKIVIVDMMNEEKKRQKLLSW